MARPVGDAPIPQQPNVQQEPTQKQGHLKNLSMKWIRLEQQGDQVTPKTIGVFGFIKDKLLGLPVRHLSMSDAHKNLRNLETKRNEIENSLAHKKDELSSMKSNILGDPEKIKTLEGEISKLHNQLSFYKVTSLVIKETADPGSQEYKKACIDIFKDTPLCKEFVKFSNKGKIGVKESVGDESGKLFDQLTAFGINPKNGKIDNKTLNQSLTTHLKITGPSTEHTNKRAYLSANIANITEQPSSTRNWATFFSNPTKKPQTGMFRGT